MKNKNNGFLFCVSHNKNDKKEKSFSSKIFNDSMIHFKLNIYAFYSLKMHHSNSNHVVFFEDDQSLLEGGSQIPCISVTYNLQYDY